jgi:hypothetical protein
VDVSYGERTVDEMCLAFLAVTLGPAKADAPPVVTRASWDKSGALVVAARNLGRGGRIEVNGVALADSESLGTGRLRSASDYGAFFTLNDPTPPAPADIRVRRADGRLSKPYTLTF